MHRTHTHTAPAHPHTYLQMHWWRLVVDEAQMVGPLSTAGTMCEQMSAVHRWCVTGEWAGGTEGGNWR